MARMKTFTAREKIMAGSQTENSLSLIPSLALLRLINSKPKVVRNANTLLG